MYVRCDRDESAVLLTNHDTTVKGTLRRIVAPSDEPVDDLHHFIEPWRS